MIMSKANGKKVKTEEDFDKIYTRGSVVSEVFNYAGQEGMLETFGNDMKLVRQIHKKTPKRVWTAVECEKGLFLLPGLHYVNRLYYVITNEDAKNANEAYFLV